MSAYSGFCLILIYLLLNGLAIMAESSLSSTTQRPANSTAFSPEFRLNPLGAPGRREGAGTR